MARNDVIQALTVRFQAEGFALGVVVEKTHLRELVQTLRDTYGYRQYVLASATDRGETLEVVHGFRHPESGEAFFVKVVLPADQAEVDSLVDLFAGANWYEREVYDLFGIPFTHHPDLRRILMPEDYEGHPLRKSFRMDTGWGYRPDPTGATAS